MSQWGFVGPAYQAANPGQDDQALINWFVEYDPNEPNPQAPTVNVAEAKVALGLLGVPGLAALSTAYSGEVRGAWVLPGRTTGIIVIGSLAFLATASSGALTMGYIGTLSSSTGRVGIRDNGAGKLVAIVDGPNLYTYSITSGVFAKSADPAFLGSTSIAEIDGWFIFNEPGTQKFYTSPVYWNGTDPINGTYFALKDNAPDNLIGLVENSRELWLIGESTTEPWYNAGGTNFPFSRVEGAMMQLGCAAGQSIARTGKGLVWLATSERGGLSVVTTQGYQYTVVSTPAIAYALGQYSTVADAIGYTYTEDGHEFYVLTLPTADVTWVYDLTTQMWHQRASFDSATGQFHRQRVNCLVNMGGMFVGGDYANGRVYRQSRAYYADDDAPLVAMRRSPHVWDKNDRNRVINSRMQIDFYPGCGLATGQGSDPQAMMRFSNDGGQTWGSERMASIGQMGQTKSRVIWRRLGAARDRVYEVRISDPVKRDIAGASLKAGATDA